ncbi:MAG: carbohydrate binding family 9 domain-containing protein [Prolixibacteraceae bacterium]|nr:carbohydrate binding family 9 domain-containing protein [Prolixibacteraceae bacterium]
MKTRLLFIPVIFCVLPGFIFSQEQTKKEYYAGECSKNEISVDGMLNEPAWTKATWMDDFVQFEPLEGKKAHQKTEFAILLDEHYVNVGFKCWDTAADSIVQRLGRRDETDGDLVAIQFDSYFDKRTAFSFMVNAAGIKNDFLISNDGGNEDNTWDPIWLVKTSRDSLGWYAEMRIPLTQLRFEGGTEQTWGMQVARLLFRKQEVTLWQPTSKKISGWVSKYGELKGLKNLKSRKVADFTPYAVARTDRFEKEEGNPFRESGHKNQLDVGLDGKIGLTNNLTLDFTINPDFGQVEADPSQVNLTSFETFFQEKRPFFIEGKNILSFPLMFGDGDLAAENIFYSRRIGRRPHNNPELNDGEYKDAPEFTSILGAAKITGKTKTGWSLGVLESLTSEEFAHISNSHQRSEMIEPFTNYTIGRVQKDFDKGNTIVGGIFTSVNRNLKEDQLDYLHKSAITGGIDFTHKWHNKDWQFDFSSYFSRVEGSTEAITNTQKSWIHGFQRPDATHFEFDSTRTSLSGSGGKIVLGKYGGKLKFMAATAWKSPGLELNDVGYMRQADNILEVIWVGYRIFEPFSIFRNMNLNFNQWTEWNFAGELTGPGGNINAHTQFKNYWNFHIGGNFNGEGLSTTELRGGPALKIPGTKNIWMAFGSNEQKKITGEVQAMFLSGNRKDYKNIFDIGVSLGYRPSKSLKITLSPNFNSNEDELQYVTQQEYAGKTDYIFSRINQKTLSASLRVNYNITPDLSIQYWGQPFISSGKYSEFKRITNSRASEYNDRFQLMSTNELGYIPPDEVYKVSDTSGNFLYNFDQPDFNVKEFLSNMVVRWEYKPGSTLFLVWSQNRNQSVANGSFHFRDDLTDLFDDKPYNVFLVKMSFRIGR